MKLRIWYYVFIFSLLLFAGCKKIETGNSFDSVVDDKSRVDLNLYFTIDSIRDYRCPSDVICFWAGDVDIYMTFYSAFNQIDTLMNLYNPSRNPISVGGYSFKINEVNPVPVSYKTTPQKDYKINMIITKE